MLVIACNTASAAMLRDARERFTEAAGIPVVEVIQPPCVPPFGRPETGGSA